MGLLRRIFTVDRVLLTGVIAIQAVTIIRMERIAARERLEMEMLAGRLERCEEADRLASALNRPGSRPLVLNDHLHDPAIPLLRAQADMERVFASLFGREYLQDDAADAGVLPAGHRISRGDMSRYNHLRVLDNAFDEFMRAGEAMGPGNRLAFLSVSPAMDMREFDDCYVVAMSLPGTGRPEVSVELDGRVLSVSGRQHGRGGESWRFEKRMQFPGSIAGNAVRATLTNGVLRIVAPKGGATSAMDNPSKIM